MRSIPNILGGLQTLLLLTSLAGQAGGSPYVPRPIIHDYADGPAATVVTTSLETVSIGNQRLEMRRGGSRCELIGRNSYHIYIETWGNRDETSKEGCGSSLRRALEEQCCRFVNNWECRGHKELPSIEVAFTFGIFCVRPERCVEDTIYLVSPHNRKETGIHCM